jgi:hypothetical protein
MLGEKREETASGLAYLQAEPGVGSIVTRGDRIYIGFTGAASDRGAIVRGAALNAADATGACLFSTAKVTIYYPLSHAAGDACPCCKAQEYPYQILQFNGPHTVPCYISEEAVQ